MLRIKDYKKKKSVTAVQTEIFINDKERNTRLSPQPCLQPVLGSSELHFE